MVPAMALIGVFLVFPALWTLYLALTNYRLTGLSAAHPSFVGASNYSQAITGGDFAHSLVITLVYVFGSAAIGQCVLGFALAWKFREWRSRFRRVVEALVIVAWIIPSSVVAYLWIAYLQGSIGPLVESGTLDTVLGVHTNWLSQFPLLSLVIFNIWRGTAFSMLLFGAALQSIPPSYLEAAKLAGASGWQQLRDVVLPRTKGYVLTTLLLVSLWTFNDFTPYLLTGGGPSNQTEVLPVYVYQQAFQQGSLGYGAAISVVMLLINLLIALVYIRMLKERR
jgi:multiple sugar transport system permease protein